MKTIGRQYEQSERKRYFGSGKPEFTMFTTYGLAETGYRASVQSEVTLDDLFV